MSIPSQLIERARETDLLETARRHGAVLKRVSAIEWAGPCSRCGGRDRFSINTRKRAFNCRCCGASGDVIELVRLLDGCDFREAVERLAGRAGESRRPEVRVAADLETSPLRHGSIAKRNAEAMLLLGKMAAEREDAEAERRQLERAPRYGPKLRRSPGATAKPISPSAGSSSTFPITAGCAGILVAPGKPERRRASSPRSPTRSPPSRTASGAGRSPARSRRRSGRTPVA